MSTLFCLHTCASAFCYVCEMFVCFLVQEKASCMFTVCVCVCVCVGACLCITGGGDSSVVRVQDS